MMPDKIYIPQNISRSDVTSLSFPDDKGRGIEFIRKDALLEWVRKTKDEALNEVPMLDVLTLQKVIDKLNKM